MLQKVVNRWDWSTSKAFDGRKPLSSLVTVVGSTPADNLQDQEDDISNQNGEGDGVESNTRNDALLKVLAQEEEDELLCGRSGEGWFEKKGPTRVNHKCID